MIYNYVITLLFCLSSCASKKDFEESSGRWIIFLWHYYLKKIIQYCGYHKIKLSVLTGTRLVYLTSHYFFRTILLKDRYITVKVHLLLLVLVLLYTIMGNDLSVVNILNYINRIHGEYYNMTNLKEKKKKYRNCLSTRLIQIKCKCRNKKSEKLFKFFHKDLSHFTTIIQI